MPKFRTVLLLCLLSPVAALAQAVPTSGSNQHVQVGGEFTYTLPDYGQQDAQGASGFVSYDFSRFVGVEADAHFGTLRAPGSIREKSFLVGPRFFYHAGRFTPYVRATIGRAFFQGQGLSLIQGNTTTNYTAFGFGGGLEIRATRRILIRAVDGEFQRWTNFPPSNLSPLVLSSGVAFRFH